MPIPPRPSGFRKPTQALLSLSLATVLIAGQAQSAHAWGTEEHIQFGDRIADPFESILFQGDLPVLRSTLSNDRPGPSLFGHWVSAPDFGRSLSMFLNLEAIVGDLACAVLWNDKGVTLGGEDFHDQLLVDDPEAPEIDVSKLSLLEKRAHLDCLGLAAVNNNHFGDFARNQFTYYHEQALEAARRYRATRNPECQSAAYTLEGWSQHYLTDSTAAGHAWNPPGSYEDDRLVFSGKFINKVTGLPIRMRIHQHLNKSGARMAGSLFEKGTFWGDHSEDHTATGETIPASTGESAQRDLTMRLARMALGDVVAATECGAATDRGDSVFLTHDADSDPRRLFVSNDTMCDVMWRFVPGFLSKALFQHPGLDDFVDDCDAKRGVYEGDDPAGDIFASCYFKDVFENTDKNTCAVSDEIDSRGRIDLAELGCPARDPDFPNGVRPLEPGNEIDMCGNRLCETPIRVDGSCPFGMDASAGCCVGEVDLNSTESDAHFGKTWGKRQSEVSTFATDVSYPGAPASFLWAENSQAQESNGDTDWTKVSGKTIKFDGTSGLVGDCTGEAQSTTYETRIKMPAGAALKGKALYLSLLEFDEAVRVRVDGQLIGTYDRSSGQDRNDFDAKQDLASGIRVQLLTPASSSAGEEGHHLEVTVLNSCDGGRPLQLKLSVDDAGCLKCDELIPGSDTSGCNIGGGAGGGAAGLLLLLALGLLARRRENA